MLLLLATGLLAIVLGYWEALTVAYLRRALGIPPGASNVLALERIPRELLRAEQLRELTVLVLLALIALLSAPNLARAPLVLGWSFGVWDVSYYAWLRRLVGWPRSLVVLDLFLLFPRPWMGPVWLPVSISTALALGCAAALLLG